MDTNEIINFFNLEPLPKEGGFYRRIYNDSYMIPESALENKKGGRSCVSFIYYLITPESFSGLHCVSSTEIFHFYAGDPVRMIQINQNAEFTERVLGNNFINGEFPQAVVNANVWQGTKLLSGGSWALMGCTVAPGFEFDDFINGERKDLIKQFPQYSKIITDYTHQADKQR